ncbi:MAG: ABC transporter permease subunit [Planctomycetota bacterium]|jgi:hypothetical protein
MFRTVFAIAKNTLSETLRQSVFGVLLAFSCFMIAMSPAFAMFTFLDSVKLVQDMGLATILLSGLFLGVLSSANVISREIEGRTALTVLSKPVSRTSFVLGKFIGISAAIAIATYIQTVVLLLTYRLGVKDTASTVLDWGALAGIVLALLFSLLIAFYYNYFLNKPFMTISVWAVFFCLTLSFVFFLFFDKDYHFEHFGSGLNLDLGLAAILILQAIMILVAISVMASTYVKLVSNLVICFSSFLIGLTSQYIAARVSGSFVFIKYLLKVIPDFQIFWVTEAMTEGKSIPASYVGCCGIYTFFYIGAVLLMGILLFSRREVTD